MRIRSYKAKLTFFSVALAIGVSAVWVFDRYFSISYSDQLAKYEVEPVRVVPLGNADDKPCDWLNTGQRLTPAEAVSLTECFVEANGYTDMPPVGDRSKLTAENVYPGTDEEEMRNRRNSLERAAYGYWESSLYGGGWEIAFRYVRNERAVAFYGDRLDTVARCVWMNYESSEINVRHTDCLPGVPGFQRLAGR